ncbi:uncharacterized protein HMPREF1541_06699 [Cyphellophora europaea CBS 101466]|uniref:ZW10 C-terminal helical domain-containing protein n=1 Tax=Cyphellophora europaea (strain CBS 101466) TaxID=1220924 RepID=W2RQA7_CYPE1|nr:uncharacterized protein HMPREF1541_06699 [Cyphellophora europaea CBS 101466]ETN38662.1 hypothetical protein HMPREF1541_06699 [Cyphellophora europaea CBS 101466]
MAELASSLIGPIREGTFPETASVLSADITSGGIPELLESIAKAKDELSAEIRDVGRPYADGVDQWITQAKKVQEDIAQCKQDAQEIVQEHVRLELLRKEASDAASKARLLEDEIQFTKDLQTQLHNTSNVHQQMRAIEDSLSEGHIVEAAKALKDIDQHVSRITGPRVKSIINEYKQELRSKTRTKLERDVTSRVAVQYDGSEGLLSVEDTDVPTSNNASLVEALDELDAADAVLETIADKLETFVLRVLSIKSIRHLSAYYVQGGSFKIILGNKRPEIPQILSFSKDIVVFLHASLPEKVFSHIANALAPRFMSALVTDWLTPAIPMDLNDLTDLDSLGMDVAGLAEVLDTHRWPKASDLRQWTQHAPRMWIAKRKSEALDAVRKAFALSQGSLHQVERVERQKASTLDTAAPSKQTVEEPSDDWNTSWDEAEKTGAESSQQTEGDEDTSGWGFDDEMDESQQKNTTTNGQDKTDDGEDADVEAWGWGDDDNEAKPANEAKSSPDTINGDRPEPAASQELVLTELYSITDIPDHLLERIGKDIQDGVTLQGENHASLRGVPASSGLLALPALSVAMFRATAPTYYAKNASLGNMNLYNDALYIADKLRSMPEPAGMKDIEAECTAMEKFARSAYAREMDTQRTILGDLLDGVQGFTIPYAEQIEDAIASTSDRLRQVHAEWSPVLSTSALLQSTGALLSSVLSKVITDIEEMDDISEAQSQRLGNFCAQLAKLEDLFITRSPEDSQSDQEAVPMVAVYCPNWLRFQYLINILESNLQDIKYLWTEGELSLEFSQEEVVDLVKALFAESSHRRSAIAAIRGHRGSGL